MIGRKELNQAESYIDSIRDCGNFRSLFYRLLCDRR